MKTIGMLGGMSWESTASYYKAINEGVKSELGGLHSAKICLYSVNFDEIEKLQHQGSWHETASILTASAKAVEAGGADFLIICTNTMHKVANEIEANISIPILHIADATAQKLVSDGVKKVGLLGTRFTMEQDFYKQRLIEKFGIDVIVPDSAERNVVHDIIYNELCRGVIDSSSREKYLEIVASLHKQGAEAVILGCTEIALLIQQEHTSVPLYDTTEIHANAAVQLSISGAQAI
ncbi:aspartate/glutamate racemase family protein [Vibrio parahaemolyticus]|uniref:Amino acid racemase n=2 Tax=Vibrio aestuarianus TaxID=28171 RepID=A0ABN8TL97_9VIBR|nr:aspartate/glutamate racemase family protein [Vibrio aestuarianus]EGR1549706.1 aspartate/glutamate racemase family protein [Vibrio parahaemolyticus]EJC6794216.1 aspartate/glutamate racemase family protein [Vibrio parahaemolyticus]EJC6850678.1 aspartate/glutamate racemase family protein [Vibrio parahaemolyticus]EJC7138165.1 aspartate/glutamate racemase family protein [Vibrio parahaemolyticus]EKG9570708.1 aspartate/glutamate racemase family protein [Vibrio parahaemolyticus]